MAGLEKGIPFSYLMGYYNSAMVLAREPNWLALDSLQPNHTLRGYAHKDASAWLLDCSRMPERGGGVSDYFRSPYLAGDGIGLASTIEAIRKVLGRVTAYGTGDLHAVVDVSHRLDQVVYFFAADDDITDMAVESTPDGTITMGAWYGSCRFAFNGGVASITPVRFEEDEEALDSGKLVRLKSIPGLVVIPEVVEEEGRLFYEHPVRLWPSLLPDPELLLGLGTWDPFERFEDDFTLIYSRPAVS
jgi:hypothetical protein